MRRIRSGILGVVGALSVVSAALAETPSDDQAVRRALELQQREMDVQLNLGLAGVRTLEDETPSPPESDDPAAVDSGEHQQ